MTFLLLSYVSLHIFALVMGKVVNRENVEKYNLRDIQQNIYAVEYQ